jgi:hypothetical protein
MALFRTGVKPRIETVVWNLKWKRILFLNVWTLDPYVPGIVLKEFLAGEEYFLSYRHFPKGTPIIKTEFSAILAVSLMHHKHCDVDNQAFTSFLRV